MMNLLVLLGGLGLFLTAGAVLGLLAEIAYRKPHNWGFMALAALVYIVGLFVAPPPHEWQALMGRADLGTTLRAAGLGLFLAPVCLAYINAWRSIDELRGQVKRLEVGKQ